MFATVNRDEDSEPLEFPESLPRPGDQPEAGPDAGPPKRTGTSAGSPTAEELTRFFL
ncbi:hypothetical protein QF035_005714 [Streptomyces umbrinus]|uniref:Uncharacterized protein n=2 Tax=Streptomyces umbrinus TaxID=67370 RepID=A0ABU0SXV6_9ACTN|nr:hypothetical protein [Streptomyces umbrinus]